jgi:Icc-related predicted phosphoesterase
MTPECFFVSDLHGRTSRYQALFAAIRGQRPQNVFLGGDLLPFPGTSGSEMIDFAGDFLIPQLSRLRNDLKEDFPAFFLIPGNDDPAAEVESLVNGENHKLWVNLHNKRYSHEARVFWGYAFVPPTPFRLKDWEKYDVSRYVDPGSIDPLEGFHSIPVAESQLKFSTIEKDLEILTAGADLSNDIFLFHTPPYQTNLDRAALDGKTIDHAPLDVHVGSIAVRRFIEGRQPLLTLHGHIHESARLTGSWKDRIGKTWMFSAAHDGPELALVRFDPDRLDEATRVLL